MGMVKIDTSKRAVAYDQEFDLGTAGGVLRLLRRFHDIHSRRRDGDLEAAIILLDFTKALREAPLTPREKAVLYLLYEKSLTRKETARELGISVQAVRDHKQKAAHKIAKQLRGYSNV